MVFFLGRTFSILDFFLGFSFLYCEKRRYSVVENSKRGVFFDKIHSVYSLGLPPSLVVIKTSSFLVTLRLHTEAA